MGTTRLEVKFLDELCWHFACLWVEPINVVQFNLTLVQLLCSVFTPSLQPNFLVVRCRAIWKEFNQGEKVLGDLRHPLFRRLHS